MEGSIPQVLFSLSETTIIDLMTLLAFLSGEYHKPKSFGHEPILPPTPTPRAFLMASLCPLITPWTSISLAVYSIRL